MPGSGAQAAHWPGFGADAGRSGNQPVDAGVAPLAPVWTAVDGAVKTSPITSGGLPASQRVIYGTSDGVVHIRRLSDGGELGSADVGDDADVFGTGSATPGENRASVSFADTSTEAELGQVFAAHNDGAGIEIAQLDLASGDLVQELAVPGTTGMTIDSSLLATSTDLFFVAGGRVFKVPVADAQTPGAEFGTPVSGLDENANPVASPTLMYLDVLGTPTAHVAVGTTDGFLRTYRASDLLPGPFIALTFPLGPGDSIDAFEVMTPSVPVAPGGTPAPGGAIDEAPFVYVAANGQFTPFPDPEPPDPDPLETIVYKLRVVGGVFEFQYEFLPIPDTLPAPALSTSQLASSPDPEDIEDAEVLITTTTNLFLATTRDMDLTGEIDFFSSLEAGTTGLQQTTAATSGPLYYVTNDSGEQIVGRLSDGKPLEAGDFERDAANAGAPNGGAGQPAVARGYVAFGGPDGVFVYRNRDATPPRVELTAPAADSTVSGAVTVAAVASDERGVEQVEFRANARSLGVDTNPADGFSLAVDTDAMPAGEYVIDAIADDGTLTTLSAPRRVVIRTRGEDAPPGVEFTRPAAGARVSGRPTLSANAADDRGVASVRFLAGGRVVCTDMAAPYECDYRLTADDVGRTTLVAVATDTAGQTGAAVRTVTVSRFVPRSLSATTAPRTDRRRPFRFTTSGRLRLPAGIARKQACGSGDVAVQIQAVRKTISTRRVALGSSCRYRSRVSFRSRNRFPKSGRLTVRVRFLGNAVMGPHRAKSVTLRTR